MKQKTEDDIILGKQERMLRLPRILDIASKDPLEQAFTKLGSMLESENISCVWLDARTTESCSAGGLGVFIRLIDEFPANYVLFGANEKFQEALQRIDSSIPCGSPKQMPQGSIRKWLHKASNAILGA